MADFDYVITARRVKGEVFDDAPGKAGPIKYLKVPAQATAPAPAHAVQGAGGIKQWVDEVQRLADDDPNPHSVSPTGDVLVFVHGYNNSGAAALASQRRLCADLAAEGWRGVVIAFDWPSGDSTLAYLEDRSDASNVAIELVRRCVGIVKQGQEEGCRTNIHLLGHSTGAYVIMDAFAQAEKDGDLFKSAWRIGQVAFISGDVSSSRLSATDAWSQPMFKRIMRLTNYSNGFDAVLAVSNAKRLGTSPRAGRVGLPPNPDAKAVNVDCSEYFKSKPVAPGNAGIGYTHSWQFGDLVFTRDLAMALEGAIDRNVIPTRAIRDGKLVLVDGARPAFQSVVTTKPALRESPG
jgi:pimeloyl-ACP methyl ester carboxylesterase